MVRFARPLNADDKILLAAVLLNAGVKARIAKLNMGFRVVFTGSCEAVAEALNDAGFLAAGGAKFDRFNCNATGQVFVRMAAG